MIKELLLCGQLTAKSAVNKPQKYEKLFIWQNF